MGPEIEGRLYTLPWILLNSHFQSDGALDPGLVPQPFVAMEQIWNYIIAHWKEGKISAHNSGFLFFSSATWQVDQHTPPCAGFSKTLPSMRSSGKLCICRFGFLVCFSGGLFCVCPCMHSSCECACAAQSHLWRAGTTLWVAWVSETKPRLSGSRGRCSYPLSHCTVAHQPKLHISRFQSNGHFGVICDFPFSFFPPS